MEFLTSRTQFPVCAYETDNIADQIVIWNQLHSYYPSKDLFSKIKVDKVSNSNCNLTEECDQFCIETASKDYWVTKVINYVVRK